ncbi:MAG: DUF4160 domain-containing protein [Synergistaceae bacterium]|nr:DUF4160 domain-containing protein [Synergistaceae bacterium]
MPTILRVGRYVIFFWSNENNPREPIHVHVAIRRAVPNATKLWITSTGEVIVDNNNSRIPSQDLQGIIDTVKKNIPAITEAWFTYFGEIKYFC